MHGSSLSSTSSTTIYPSQPLHFPQSLLILIKYHLLRRLYLSHRTTNHTDSHHMLRSLINLFPSFFTDIGFTSQRFFDSAVSAIKLLFESTIFQILPNHLTTLTSIASVFDAQPRSVMLEVTRSSKVEEFAPFTTIICGLFLDTDTFTNYEFFCRSSPLFCPRLTHLTVDDYFTEASFTVFVIYYQKTNQLNSLSSF
ncbi:hypothetical protein GEMRC1_000582 [Eukaryota sp. GEM-RC1]